MINFQRYPHVKNLIEHYSVKLDEPDILELLNSDILSETQAEYFSKFIWRMLDQMAIDIENKESVLGNIDNSSMVPDIDYEVSLYLSEMGLGHIWERVCDES